MSVLATLLFWTAAAIAGEVYFEGPVHTVRADAVASSRSVREAGHEARVVRRYADGTGWEYLVRVSGFADTNAAIAAAPELAASLGPDLALFSQEGDDGDPVQVNFSLERVRVPSAPTDDADPEDLEPSPLADTVAAHGGPGGGVERIHGAKTVLFKFRRTLPGGEVVDHTWARRGDDVYLAVDKVAGEVQPSRILVLADGAWLSVDKQPWTAQDRERSLETVGDLAPERVVPFVLSFASLADDRKELQSIREDEPRDLDGKRVRVLHSDGDRSSGPLVLEVDAQSALVRRVVFNDGAMEVRFDTWDAHPDAPVRLPGQVRLWREGQLVDTVEIAEISLDGDLPKEWFQAPPGAPPRSP